MKTVKIVIKIFAAIVIVIILDYSFGVIMRFFQEQATEKSPGTMTPEYAIWKTDANLLIVGASEATHSYVPSILEDSLNVTVYNCGYDGTGFLYHYCIINEILDRYSPKYIIWAITPYYLSNDNNMALENLTRLNCLYKGSNYIKKVSCDYIMWNKIKLISSTYQYNSRILENTYQILFPDSKQKNGYRPLYGTTLNDTIPFTANYNYKMDDNIKKLFEQTVERCNTKNVKLILSYTPRFEIVNFTKMQSHKEIKEISNKYNTPLIYDYYSYNGKIPPSYYRDRPHLNNDGAKMFTSYLAEEILKTYKNNKNKHKYN